MNNIRYNKYTYIYILNKKNEENDVRNIYSLNGESNNPSKWQANIKSHLK